MDIYFLDRGGKTKGVKERRVFWVSLFTVIPGNRIKSLTDLAFPKVKLREEERDLTR